MKWSLIILLAGIYICFMSQFIYHPGSHYTVRDYRHQKETWALALEFRDYSKWCDNIKTE